MPLTITLPDPLAARLQEQATREQQSLEVLAATLLEGALEEREEWPSLGGIVAAIKATPPNPSAVHPATHSLAELLDSGPPPDPDFDLAEWNREWQKVEAEMKARDRADDIAEGRW